MSLHKIHIANIAFMLTASFSLPVFGAGGDGSGVNNDDLLRNSLGQGCYDPIFCQPYISKSNVSQTQPPNQAIILEAEDPLLDENIVNFPVFIAQEQILPSPATVYDWNFSLRGAFQKDHNGERFEIIATPTFSILHQNRNSQFESSISASLSKQIEGEYRLFGVAADFNSNHILDRETKASLGANINVDQQSPNDPSLSDTIAQASVIITGGANGTITRQFARLSGELRGSVARTVYEESQLIDGTWQDNSTQNNTNFGTGLRLSYELTPIFDIFADGSFLRTNFDNDSIVLATSQSNSFYAIRAGISGNWRDVILAQASVGYGLLQYDSALIEDVPATVLEASLTYISGTGAELSANFTKNISAADPTLGASTRSDYTTSALASYQINDWLRARASLSAGWANYVGIEDIERSFLVGVGADYKLSRFTSLSADYSFGSFESTSLGTRESQTIELGITFSR